MRKPYHRRPSRIWWIDLASYSRLRRAYTYFMLRELSAVFVAGYAVLLLVLANPLISSADESIIRETRSEQESSYYEVEADRLREDLVWYLSKLEEAGIRRGEYVKPLMTTEGPRPYYICNIWTVSSVIETHERLDEEAEANSWRPTLAWMLELNIGCDETAPYLRPAGS